jgi:hypothetical protein
MVDVEMKAINGWVACWVVDRYYIVYFAYFIFSCSSIQQPPHQVLAKRQEGVSILPNSYSFPSITASRP